MKKKLNAILLILVGAVISVLLLVFSNPSKQSKDDTIFKAVTIAGKLKLIKDSSTEHQYSVIKEYEGSIYAITWDENFKNILYQFNKESLQVEKEFKLSPDILTFKIDDYFIFKDSIIILNKDLNEILTMNRNFQTTRKFKFPTYGSRIIVKNNKILYSDWDDSFKLYYKHINNNVVSADLKIDDVLISEYGSGIIYDGYFSQNEVYAVALPYSANKAIVFDQHLNYLKKIQLRYEDLDFQFVKASNGDVYPSPNNLNPNLSGFVDADSLLYVLMTQSVQFDTKDKCFIDVYSIETGKYLHSFHVPDLNGSAPRSFIKQGNQFVILYDKNIAIFKIL